MSNSRAGRRTTSPGPSSAGASVRTVLLHSSARKHARLSLSPPHAVRYGSLLLIYTRSIPFDAPTIASTLQGANAGGKQANVGHPAETVEVKTEPCDGSLELRDFD